MTSMHYHTQIQDVDLVLDFLETISKCLYFPHVQQPKLLDIYNCFHPSQQHITTHHYTFLFKKQPSKFIIFLHPLLQPYLTPCSWVFLGRIGKERKGKEGKVINISFPSLFFSFSFISLPVIPKVG